MLTDQISSQIRIFNQFMAQQQDEDLIRYFERERQPSILGSKEFITWVKNRFFKKKIEKEIPASQGLAPDLDRIISEVNRYSRSIGTVNCIKKNNAISVPS